MIVAEKMNGNIAVCSNKSCNEKISYNTIMQRTIQTITNDDQYRFDIRKRRLEQDIYERQKDRYWFSPILKKKLRSKKEKNLTASFKLTAQYTVRCYCLKHSDFANYF